ncbi:YIP1 family protein [Chloroflexia bacterium SDU3-3]|nr:YIP1 family protein [Chloroflexia bacterium SDU3-3]
MIVQGVSISAMLNQSIVVLTKPSVQSFEQFERAGGQREGLIYVAVAAVFSLLGGLLGGLVYGVIPMIIGAVFGIITPIILYFTFSYVLNWIGKQQGSTGTQSEVFYTTALYVAPLLAVNGLFAGITGLLPILACATAPVSLVLGIYQLYLAYLATRSSMNLDQNKAIISVVVAIVAQFIVAAIIGSINAALLAPFIFAATN